MEVIKSGINPTTWSQGVGCPRCEAHLKISCKDIYIHTTRKQTFFSWKHILHYLTECSECGCKIELDENKLPDIIKKKVFDDMDIVDKLLNFYFS